MKKVLVATIGIVMIAAACNQQAVVQPAPTPTPTAVQPTPTPVPNAATANWKIYTNSSQCYSIKYNGSYRLSKDGMSLMNYEEGKPTETDATNVPKGGVLIAINRNNSPVTNQSFTDYVAEANKDYQPDYANKIVPYTLGNIKYNQKILNGPSGAYDAFYVPLGSKAQWFELDVVNMNNDTKNVELILSTFDPTCK